MATTKSTIPPFPSDIDRDYFGAWLSGFTDGEACFFLGFHNRTKNGYAAFRISLRNDDIEILCLIQSYFKVGYINPKKRTKKRKYDTNPMAEYTISGIEDMERIVIPHFQQNPLLAKKRRDFEIWKRGVEFLCEVKRRRYSSSKHMSTGRPRKWGYETSKKFTEIRNELVGVRVYDSTKILPITPMLLPNKSQLMLFAD